jgi:hypothetical protein
MRIQTVGLRPKVGFVGVIVVICFLPTHLLASLQVTSCRAFIERLFCNAIE